MSSRRLYKGVYTANHQHEYAAQAGRSCRIETQSGTVYWLSPPDDEGYRAIIREPARDASTGTLLVQGAVGAGGADGAHLTERFRGKLGADAKVGMSLNLQVFGTASRVLSEVVVRIEEGNVPPGLFE
jgi:hypothetical protein